MQFLIPNYLPLRLNQLLRSHWRVRQVAQQEADNLVALYGKEAGIPPAKGKRRVSLTFLGARSDPDARLKLLLDALVHAALLVNDSPSWCELGEIRNAPGSRGVLIRLEEVG